MNHRLAAALLIVGCGSEGATVSTGSLAIVPGGEVRIEVGATVALSATDVDGPVDVVWSCSPPEVATIDDSGRLTGLSPGTARVTARRGDVQAVSPVLVRAPGEQTLTLEPSELVIPLGQVGVATLLADGGDVTSQAQWTTADREIVGIIDSGQVLAKAVGVTTVRATLGGDSIEAGVRVTPAVDGEAGQPSVDPDDDPGGDWQLGPWLEEGEDFRPLTGDDALPLGTCGQGAYHLWLSGLASAGPAERVWATATMTVVHPDPRERSVRVLLDPTQAPDGGRSLPAIRVDFTRAPEAWIGRTVDAVLIADDPEMGATAPARFVITDGRDLPGMCCDPCGPVTE